VLAVRWRGKLQQGLAAEAGLRRAAFLRRDLVLADVLIRKLDGDFELDGTRLSPRTWRVRPVATTVLTAASFFSPPSASRAAAMTAPAASGGLAGARESRNREGADQDDLRKARIFAPELSADLRCLDTSDGAAGHQVF
jgi:hypothetical protein